MFHAYISHAQARGYLGELIDKGLIENDILNSRQSRSTPKGLKYLAGLETMSELLTIETRRIPKSDANIC